MAEVNPTRPIIKQTRGVWDLNETYSETQEGYYKYGGPQQGVTSGMNNTGQLGQNNKTSYSSPVQIMGTSPAGGDDYGANSWESGQSNCYSIRAVKRDGTLWTWGYNQNGQLGHNNRTAYSSPVQIPGNWLPIMSSTRMCSESLVNDVFLALRTMKYGATDSVSGNASKKLFMWGNNTSGELGQNNNTKYSSPVQIPGRWVAASGGGGEGPFGAINEIGQLFTWGSQQFGGLGQNETYSPSKKAKSSPSQVEGGGTWKDVKCGNIMGIALKADGTTWGWGNNGPGALGLNDTINRSSPTLMPGTNWKKVCWSSSYGTARINEDNELWVQGGGGKGFLMQNNTVSYSSPIQIPGSWQDYYLGAGDQAYALKTDGTLWGTGKNPNGQFPNVEPLSPGNANRSSPIQIPGIWKEVGPSGRDLFGIKYG